MYDNMHGIFLQSLIILQYRGIGNDYVYVKYYANIEEGKRMWTSTFKLYTDVLYIVTHFYQNNLRSSKKQNNNRRKKNLIAGTG